MDPTAIIADIETIRANDLQVLQKISLLETQTLRLKRLGPMDRAEKDGTNWFLIEAMTEELVLQCQQTESDSMALCSQFDIEIQKIVAGSEKHRQQLLQALGQNLLQEKIMEAERRLDDTRQQLSSLRQQQNDLTQLIESESQQSCTNQTAIMQIEKFLNAGKSFKQNLSRLTTTQNQLRALEKRIAVTKSMNAANPYPTRPNTGGSRIPVSRQDAITPRQTVPETKTDPSMTTMSSNHYSGVSSSLPQQGRPGYQNGIRGRLLNNRGEDRPILQGETSMWPSPRNGNCAQQSWADDFTLADTMTLEDAPSVKNPNPTKHIESLCESDDDNYAIYID